MNGITAVKHTAIIRFGTAPDGHWAEIGGERIYITPGEYDSLKKVADARAKS